MYEQEKQTLNEEDLAKVAGGGLNIQGGPNLTLQALQYYFPSDKCHELVHVIENEILGKCSLETAKKAFLDVGKNLNYIFFRNWYIYGGPEGENPYI